VFVCVRKHQTPEGEGQIDGSSSEIITILERKGGAVVAQSHGVPFYSNIFIYLFIYLLSSLAYQAPHSNTLIFSPQTLVHSIYYVLG
jgi:hypothetical protein